jgi:hypothetical protein
MLAASQKAVAERLRPENCPRMGAERSDEGFLRVRL